MGIDPVRIVTQSPNMEFEDIEVDEYLKIANIFYEKDAEIISYIINCSQRRWVWGFDIEDTLVNKYIYASGLNGSRQLRNISVEGVEEKKYSARFDYKDVHYQLDGES